MQLKSKAKAQYGHRMLSFDWMMTYISYGSSSLPLFIWLPVQTVLGNGGTYSEHLDSSASVDSVASVRQALCKVLGCNNKQDRKCPCQVSALPCL